MNIFDYELIFIEVGNGYIGVYFIYIFSFNISLIFVIIKDKRKIIYFIEKFIFKIFFDE